MALPSPLQSRAEAGKTFRLKTRRVYSRATAALWLVATGAFSLCAHALDFSRIEYWSGSGTNCAALVVDWNDGGRPEALAWGFRWNEEATALDLWQAVTNADRGLSGILTNIGGAIHLTGIEYRRPSRPGDVLPATGQHDVYRTAYSRDYTGEVFHAGTWHVWLVTHTNYAPSDMTGMVSTLNSVLLTDNTWMALSFSPENAATLNRPGYALPAIHYPYAAESHDYFYGYGGVPVDWVDFVTPFNNPQVALGRPTVDTTDEWGEDVIPVVPVQPAFRAHELVSIGDGGYLELAFDHPVLDHPDNPYGYDLIVFGNGFQNLISGTWTNGNPHASITGTNGNYELGMVSVSQDGVSWVTLTNGPYADDFAPTLGRVYDPDRIDTNLGAWNLWWGGSTDPTIPIDPSLAPADWLNLTVAEISARYRGSAGGTAFDISGLDLAPDPANGRKWIRYVRMVRMHGINPEVDAVADVSPVAPYEHWRMTQFAWLDEPGDERDDNDADGDGTPTLLEYASGGDPLVEEATPFMAMTLDQHGQPGLQIADAPPDVRLFVEACNDLSAAAWCDDASAPENEMPHQFFRLKVRHD